MSAAPSSYPLTTLDTVGEQQDHPATTTAAASTNATHGPSSSSSSSSSSRALVYQQTTTGTLSGNSALPVPRRTPGFRLGSASAPLQLEMFICLQCPASARAYSTILQVYHQHSEQLSLLVVPMVLPAHRQAYHLLKSSIIAALSKSSPPQLQDEMWLRYVRYLYDRRLDRFSNQQFNQKTEEDLVNHACRVVLEFHAEAEETFDTYYAQMKGDEVDVYCKPNIRLAGRRGVVSTPTFFLNGVELITIDSNTSVSEWDHIIRALS